MKAKFLTSELLAQYRRDGFFIVRSLFDEQEMQLLRRATQIDKSLHEGAHQARDGEGGAIKLSLWNEAKNDIYGSVARSERLVNIMEELLEDEVYHWHSKMILKEPFVGGAWAWHQDYGYWYKNACLFPDLASAMIAVDAASRENGCLQVLRGSHRMGRIDHMKVGDQTGADPERVAEAAKRLALVYCECAVGDTIIFHSNTLHRSDRNSSRNPRWALICCYNSAHNSPFRPSDHPDYSPLIKVPDTAIKDTGIKLIEKSYFQPTHD